MNNRKIVLLDKNGEIFKKEVTLYFKNNAIYLLDIATYYKDDAGAWEEDNFISFTKEEVLKMYKFIANYI